jgi:hypothetical protein
MKKALFPCILPWFLIMVVIVLTSCKKKDKTEPEQDVIISPSAKVFTQQLWQQSIVSIDSANLDHYA